MKATIKTVDDQVTLTLDRAWLKTTSLPEQGEVLVEPLAGGGFLVLPADKLPAHHRQMIEEIMRVFDAELRKLADR